MLSIKLLNCGKPLRASRSYNVTGNGKRECGTKTIKILEIGQPRMKDPLTQLSSLTHNGDGECSTTIPYGSTLK